MQNETLEEARPGACLAYPTRWLGTARRFSTLAQLWSLNLQRLLFAPKARQPVSAPRIFRCIRNIASNFSVPRASSSSVADIGFDWLAQREAALATVSAKGNETGQVLDWGELQRYH